MNVHNVLKKKYNQIMRKLLILTFCLLFTACAGNRTLDGETNKNWIKIVSSKVDRSGTAQDVCFLLDLSFYPGTVYDRLKNNPNSCLDECCWYSENKEVEYYFNDGFIRELENTGTSRRYYPDHITIKMTYSPFLNRLSAKATTPEGITKDGVVILDYDDISKTERLNDASMYKVEAKIYPEKVTKTPRNNGSVHYKTISMSGLNRDELLARAKAERDEYYAKAINERYVSPEKEYVEESMAFTGQISPFDYPEDKEEKWLSKKTLAEEEALRQARYKQNRYTQEEKERALREGKAIYEPIEYKGIDYGGKDLKGKNIKGKVVYKEKDADGYITYQIKDSDGKITTYKTKDTGKKNDDAMYDVQRLYSEEAKIVYIEPQMPEKISSSNLKKKLAYERKEAVKLLKRFYGDEIDAYLRALDKYKRTEGKVLFTGDKIWQAAKIGTTVYQIDCNVKGGVASIGTKVATEDYPIYCGSYIVDLDEKTVEARDSMAQRIALKDY